MKTTIITILSIYFIASPLYAVEKNCERYKYDYLHKGYGLERGEARKRRVAGDIHLSGQIEWIKKDDPNKLMQLTIDKSSVLWTDTLTSPEDNIGYDCLKSRKRCLISFNKDRVNINIVEGFVENDTYRYQYLYVTKILEGLLLTVAEKKWEMKELSPFVILNLRWYPNITNENGKYPGMKDYGKDKNPYELYCIPEMDNNPKSTKLVFNLITRNDIEFFTYVYDAENDQVTEGARIKWQIPLDETKKDKYFETKYIPEKWPELIAVFEKADKWVLPILNNKISEDMVDSVYDYWKITLTKIK